MGWEGWFTLGVVGLMAVGLVRNLAGPDTILLGGMTILMSLGVFSERLPSVPQFAGAFGNQGLITIGVLFVVAEGLSRTGAMTLVTQPMLGRPRSVGGAQLRLLGPVALLSAFLNNTPIVAMFLPVVRDWCRKTGLAPSKLFMPLSFAAILGGACTLIGTSTNLVVQGLVLDAHERGRMVHFDIHMFTIAWLGLPIALVGLVYIFMASSRLLPSRQTLEDQARDVRRYTVEMLVEPGSAVAGKTIEQAGLRHLPGVYLAEIERHGSRLVAVGPEEVLLEGDRLIFVGAVDSVADLRKIRGLSPAEDQVYRLGRRSLVEAVVSDTCPLIGKSVCEGRFRSRYDAAIIAVQRDGEHLKQKIGDIVLRPGDSLLLEASPEFLKRHRHSRHFFVVSAVDDSEPLRHDKAGLALALLGAMVLVATLTPVRLLVAALWTAGLMVLTGCCSSNDARAAINWRVLLTIGAALGVGLALQSTGAAAVLAHGLIGVMGELGPYGVLAAVVVVTILFTELVTNAGAAAIVFPIAVAAAAELNVDVQPFIMSMMLAASCSFLTPIGYQTNLMVYGPGGYRFTDYLRFGLPMTLIVCAMNVTLSPLIWPF